MSGGIAGPTAYALYTAAFGTAGGLAGKALDNAESSISKSWQKRELNLVLFYFARFITFIILC